MPAFCGQVLAVVDAAGSRRTTARRTTVPSTTLVSQAPGKKSSLLMRSGRGRVERAGLGELAHPGRAEHRHVRASASPRSRWRSSGARRPTAPAVTVTFASGFSAMNALANSPSFSPSVPMAQTVISPVALPSATDFASSWPPPASRPQPARSAVAVAIASTAAYRRCLLMSATSGGGDGCRSCAGRRAAWGGPGRRAGASATGGGPRCVRRCAVQPARRGGAELAHRLADGGEAGEPGGEHVVPAGDGEVVGHAQAGAPRRRDARRARSRRWRRRSRRARSRRRSSAAAAASPAATSKAQGTGSATGSPRRAAPAAKPAYRPATSGEPAGSPRNATPPVAVRRPGARSARGGALVAACGWCRRRRPGRGPAGPRGSAAGGDPRDDLVVDRAAHDDHAVDPAGQLDAPRPPRPRRPCVARISTLLPRSAATSS